MLTIHTGGIRQKREKRADNFEQIEKFCQFLKSFDPDYIFLPAWLISKRFRERRDSCSNFRNLFNQVCKELEIENTKHRAKIYRLAFEMANRRK